MSKIGLVIGREYFTRVKKKSFLIMTILVPFLMVAFYAAIIWISMKGGTDSQKIAIIDEAGIIKNEIPTDTAKQAIQFKLIAGESEQSFIPKYKTQGYSAFLYIPKQNIDSASAFKLHSASSTSLSTTSRVENLVEEALQNRRLELKGIDPATYKSVRANVNVENTIDTKDGEKKSHSGIALIISIVCGTLIYMMMIIYGAQVMRGVSEEKTNRVAEVIVSSVKPFELMMGKILGIGAVGLTQFLIWMVLILLGQMAIPMLFPDLLKSATDAAATVPQGAAGMMQTVTEGIASLPITKIILSFMFYFLGGYLTYASLFAAVGSVVSDDQQEAQQMMFPILMPIIIGFVIMTQAVNEPNSTLAVFGSIFPLTSPVVMMGRITYEIPTWQLIVSMLSLIACFLLFTWITAKIYRVGILMYGKKPTWREMLKWGFRKG